MKPDPHWARLDEAIERRDVRSIGIRVTGPGDPQVEVTFGDGLWSSVPLSKLRALLLAEERAKRP